MSAPSLQHWLESVLVWALLWLISRIPVVTASRLCGVCASFIGPMLPVNQVGEANLRRVLPHLTAAQRQQILRDVWRNLGQTVAEFPHLAKLRRLPDPSSPGPGWTITGEEIVRDLAKRGGPIINVTAHIGNWEILGLVAEQCGLRFAYFYRAASNPLVDRIICTLRDGATPTPLPGFPKGTQGARAALAHLGRSGNLGILVDQKLNNGIEAPFFGIPAMSPPIAASFALRFNAPIMAARVIRRGPARFEVAVEILPDIARTGRPEADVLALTTTINEIMERWIRDTPGQWLWLHRRWPEP